MSRNRALSSRRQAADTVPPIPSAADPEYAARLDAKRCTLEFSQPLPAGRLDRGQLPIEQAPLFGRNPQVSLFNEE